MFIAHFPGGYLLTRFLQRPLKTTQYLWIGLIASIFPDIDLLYFYFIDHRQTFHHEYWTHLPVFWFIIWIGACLISYITKKRTLFIVATIFCANTLLHLALDTVAGGILWLYPFSEISVRFVTVPTLHPSWIQNFVFHWTFLLEIAIVSWAAITFLKEDWRKIYS